jgi:hypothetical protein
MELGGACELEFTAETFDEIAQLSQAHGQTMMAKEDQQHITAMNEMMTIMSNGEMDSWMQSRRSAFEQLPSQ